jgi:hypothetical protein
MVVTPGGISCAKGDPLQKTIDRRVDAMTAKGDNCEGILFKERDNS